MSSRRLTGGIFIAVAIMLIAMLILVERGDASTFLRGAAIITFMVTAGVLGSLLARRFPLRRWKHR
jgi:predicted CDP-diglyceride synthetase/phosphatidate cytidylyltransferase